MSSRTITRRAFLSASALTAASYRRLLANADTIRYGLIGCGGRGVGAAVNVFEADKNTQLVAIADAFPDAIARCRESLGKQAPAAGRFDLPEERCFVGLDSYRKLVALKEVDVVLLCAPGAFRPDHLDAALAAGKDVFAEKPVAVDAAGVRRVRAAQREAKRLQRSVVVGYNRRYQNLYRDLQAKLGDEIGLVTAAECYWNSGGLWRRDRQPGWSDVEFQIRNWIHFVWLCGDIVQELLTHNLDIVNWYLGAPPVKAVGTGGRIPNLATPDFGNTFNHFTIDYTYPGARTVKAQCQVLQGEKSRIEDVFVGTRGRMTIGGTQAVVTDSGGQQRTIRGGADNPYIAEQAALIASVRSRNLIDDLGWAADASQTAVLGRLAAYTGGEVTWGEVVASGEDLMPRPLRFGPLAVASLAKPAAGGSVAPVAGGKRYALLVGVKEYNHANLPALTYTEDDVTELAAVLKPAGFDVTLLTDGLGMREGDRKPLGVNIRNHLERIIKNCTKDDTLLVAFAGHGLQFEGKDEAYFCPSDARPSKEDVGTLISLSEVYQQLDRSGAGVKLLLVDACRNDPNPNRSGINADTAPRPPRGVSALFSCSAGQRAYEHKDLRHGVFFYHVLEGLKGRAVNNRGEVTWDSLQVYVREQVSDHVGKLIGSAVKQEPNLMGNVSGKSPVMRLVK